MMLFMAPDSTSSSGRVVYACNAILGDQHGIARSGSERRYIVENRDFEYAFDDCTVAREKRIGWTILLTGPTLIAAAACLIIASGARTARTRYEVADPS